MTVHASLEGDNLRLVAGPRDADRLKLLPGSRAHVHANPPSWTCPASLYHAVLLRNLFGEDFTYGEDVHEAATYWRREESLREFPSTGPMRPELDDTLYAFQKVGVGRLLVGSAILADKPGLGKTVQALGALWELGAPPALVVTTRTMKRVWAREAARWCPEAVPYVVAGDAPRRRRILADAAADPHALVIINWESLRRHSRLAGYGSVSLSVDEKEEKELNGISFRVVIADEAHRSKDPHAKQTRALWYLGDRAKYRWALTGTPIGGNYVDLWGLLRFVCPREFPVRGLFLDRYVQMIQRPWGPEPLCLRAETKAELFWWLDQYMLRRTPEECPELEHVPSVRDVRVDVELTPKQRTAYKAMKKESMALFDGELLVATDPLTKVGRLRYCASGTPVVEQREVEDPDNPEQMKKVSVVTSLVMPSNKVDAMLELFADEALPAVVFAQSRKLIDLAAAVAADKGYRVGKITGPMTDRQRELAELDFQSGKLDAIFCNAAGGEGITLTAGKSMIFLQSPDSLIQMEQMLGRVPRIGSEREVVCAYHLVSEGTNDEAFYELAVTKTLRLEEICRDKTRLLGTL